jgi:hypothetical protein
MMLKNKNKTWSLQSQLLLPWMVFQLLTLATLTKAQFTCTLTAQDETSCIQTVGDDNDHCSWCSLAGFGFCVSEEQAETFEQSLPGVECDRYTSDDDGGPDEGDDAAATDDDDATDDDTAPAPTDDAIPDDFWTCLLAKDEASCGQVQDNVSSDGDGCTWCMNKAGFGLCMTGPAADSAAHSDWFTCNSSASTTTTTTLVATPQDQPQVQDQQDPYDAACLTVFLQDQTQGACEAATDSDGNACEWCNLAGMADVCLTQEQAEMGTQVGISCNGGTSTSASRQETIAATIKVKVHDILDFACINAFLQSPTDEGCKAAVDQEGAPCELCTYPGLDSMCLNPDQADAVAAVGMTCESKEEELEEDDKDTVETTETTIKNVNDPLDFACIMAFLQSPTKEG